MRTLPAATIAVLFASASFARPDCTDRPECWPEGSAMRTGLELAASRDQSQKMLAKQQEKLIALVSSNQKYPDERLIRALRDQHDAWLKYRSAECELVGSLSGAGGSWPSTYAIRCEANLTDRRYHTVLHAIRCIDRIPTGQKWVEQSRCLYQLGPLTIEGKA